MERESQRLSIQQNLDNKKTIEERRRLGQFSTPSDLAREIVSFGLSLLGSGQVFFLDPAFGTGSFYSALLALIDHRNLAYAQGIEIDPYYGIPAQRLWAGTDIHIKIADFTQLDPNRTFNFIICNPPYVRHHLIDSCDKLRIRNKTQYMSGIKLSGLAGLYCHFLLQSYKWMMEDGIAGWLIPSEFMDVNYGKDVKQFLLNNVELLRIHRYDPADVQFNDALVSSAVVWFRKRKPQKAYSIEFSFGGSLAQPSLIKTIDRESLAPESKWTQYPQSSMKPVDKSDARLSDYFIVKRGIATGNNDFFIMEKAKIEKLGLPFEFFRPVLPSARYLSENEILSDDNGNPIIPKQLFLLDCQLTEDVIQARYPALWDYLERGKGTVATGYLCRSRKCWYFQEQREAPPYICTYMGRDGANGSAFRFIYNHSKAIVTNSYLALYPKDDLSVLLTQIPQLRREIWTILNQIKPKHLTDEGRVYGGGLRKLEPSELLNVPVPQIEELISTVVPSFSKTRGKMLCINL
ncbi:MAG: SAM-dependent methyltransferase [Firmicutes bacterium]|nr:SAM-dependent methyltransferase [Bacillota bacterium]